MRTKSPVTMQESYSRYNNNERSFRKVNPYKNE